MRSWVSIDMPRRSSRVRRGRYVLRVGEATIASGLLPELGEFEVGDRLEVAGSASIVRRVESSAEGRAPTLILELQSERA